MAKDDEKQGDVEPEVDHTTTGETTDTTEAGAEQGEAPHHQTNDPGENLPADKDKNPAN